MTNQRRNKRDSLSLADHPGYLGLTSKGVIAIHADWPLYQLDHGAMTALESFGSYPVGTQFRLLDDIDRCALFVREPAADGRDAFDPQKSWHAVAWHEDLLDAADAGHLHGVERLTEREFEERRRDSIRASIRALGPTLEGDPLEHLFVEVHGEMRPLALPSLDEYDDEDDDWPSPKTWLGVTGSVEMTPAGWSALDEHLGTGFAVPESVQDRTLPLLSLGRFDTVVRELGAILETRMREAVNLDSRTYGLSLVNAYAARVAASGALPNAYGRAVAGELRTTMAFVRNEFAHQVADIPRPRGLALVARMCRAVEIIEAMGPLA